MIGFKSKGIPLLHVLLIYVLVILTTIVNGQNAGDNSTTLSSVTSTNAPNTTQSPTTPTAATSNTSDTHGNTSSSSGSSSSSVAAVTTTTTTPAPTIEPNTTVSSTEKPTTPRATTAQPNASSTQSTSDTTIAQTVAPTHTPPTSKTNGTSGSSPATDAPTKSSSADTPTPVSSSSTPKPTTTTLAPSSSNSSSTAGGNTSPTGAPQTTTTYSTTNVSSTPSSGTTPQNTSTASTSTTTTTTPPTTTQEPTTTTVTNYCINVTCSNGGTCKTAADNYTCECMPGYTGRHCDENKDDCASNPCKNGSTCADLVNGYNCSCVPGFSGQNCDKDIDECATSPCINGTCNNLVNNYTCDCTPGFDGYDCENDKNECATSPCINGTCNNLVNNYTCDCTPGFDGYNCDNDINECASNPCKNGATCQDRVNSYTCTCQAGYTGYNCETDIDDCEGIVCANDGRCEDHVNNYTCNCTSAWKGPNCTEDVNECDEGTHECHVLANCSNTEGSYNCTCKQGFEGDGRNCIDINECEKGYSQCNTSNTEVCFNTDGSYKCYCKPGWTSLYCDTDINECNYASTYCDANADCSNTAGGYTCTCKVGYRGNGTKCTEIVLFAIPGGENHKGDGNIFGPYKVPGGLPYHQKMYYDIYVSINGYLTLGGSYTQTYPPRNSTAWAQTGLPIIAPLWADIELKNTSTLTVNKAVTNVTVLEMLVSDSVESLADPRFGFIATWNKAVPYPYDQNWQYEEADFQVAIVTNGSSTLLIFNYDQEYFTWQSNYHDRFVSIGFSEENLSGSVFFDSNTFTSANKNGTNTISGKQGRWVFRVSTSDVTTESESKCQAWLDNEPLQDMISTALKDSDPCPCSLSQAQRDRRFKQGSSPGPSAPYSHVYKSRFPRPTNHSIQQCHYNKNQGLVRGYPGGGFMVSKTEEMRINEAYRNCCNESTRLCGMFYSKVPSDTCIRYTPPTWLPSWGDPHITTLDAVQYTFNGRGEYVFLKTDNTMVQVRTDLASEGDTDATVFVGVAAKIGNHETIEIHLNRATKTCDVYVNGTKQSGVLDISTEMMTVEGKGTDNNPIYLTLSSGIAFKITASSILDLVTSVFGDIQGKVEGLLGNHDGDKTNDFVCRNGTILHADSTEEQLYDFGTSWMVYSNESLFNYTLTGGNYNFYNNQTVRPSVFIGDHVKNLSGLITRKCMGQFNESMVNGTCGNNSACIIDALATCNLTIGEQTKHTQQQETLNREIIENQPPVFSMNETLYVGPNVTALFQLSLSVTDANDFKTTVDSNITNFTFNDTSKAFTWNITEDLKTRNVYLRFEAIDELNASSIYWPNIYYCGCAHKDQCYYSSLMETQSSAERFYRAKCNCNTTTKGEYCDQTVDVCSSNPCFGKCNSTSTSICEPCPSGYNGTANGTKCYDIDECRLETDACEQDCINTAGSYECNCTSGYKLNQNNHTCDEIDECALPTDNDCQDNQICTNIPGSYECNCMPGFVDMGNNNCQIVRYSFVVKLKITITQIPNITPGDEDIKKKIANWLNTTVFKTYTFTSIKIIFSSPATSRLRRDAGTTERVLDVTGVMQTDISTYTTDGIDKAFNKYKTDTGLVNEQLGDMPVKVDLSASRVPEDSEGALCTTPGFSKCDPISTVCQVTNGRATCSCREGFDGWLVPGWSCKDINECDANLNNCVGGINCTNQPGSFICTCNNGFKFDDVSKCIDMCSTNPCQNGGECTHGSQEGQYVCKCDDKWAGMNCERENEETSRLTTIIIIVGAVVGGICLILLIALFGVYRRMRSKQFGYSRYAGLSNLTDDNAYSMPRAKLSQDIDTPFDDTSTTFSIPRPKLTNTSHEMTDLDAISNNSNNERYAKDEGKDEERNPLASTSASTRDDNSRGRANPSFLHDETTSQRNSKIGSKPSNNYEYF